MYRIPNTRGMLFVVVGLASAFLFSVSPASSVGVAGDPADDQGQWGNVKGQIVLDAKAAPEQVKLDVTKDQPVCLAKGPLLSEALIVNKANLGVKNVFVWLIHKDIPPNPSDPVPPLAIHPSLREIKSKNVEMDQPCCMFEPHALCMRQGQVLLAKNSSTIAHNFHWSGLPNKNPGGNSIVVAGGELKIGDLVADRVPVKISCDIHPWMSGWVRVFDHPYFALTDKDGRFEIKNAPAGPCRLVTWQEDVGWAVGDMGAAPGRYGMLIDIPAGKTLDMGVLKMPPPKKD